MFDNTNSAADEERGQVGIGTLIVFIALVLVAAIAAGVLINTAGFLQNQAESTGQESTKQVTNSLSVQSTLGTQTASDSVDQITIRVAKSPGAGAINVNKSTIQYVGPDGAETLVPANTLVAPDGTGDTGENNYGEAFFQVSGSNVLDDGTTSTTIKIYLFDIADANAETSTLDTLTPGEAADIKITTASGGQSSIVATVPEPLTGSDNDQVRL
jgi:flagellin FlaB